MSESSRLTAAQAGGDASARASSTAAGAVRRLPRARRGRRAQRVPVGRRRAPRRDRGGARWPACRSRVKDLFCTEGVPEPGRLADPRGLPAAVHGDGRRAARRRRRAAARQDQPGRVRDGLVERELRPSARCCNPWDRDARARAARAAAAPPRSPPASRRGRSAPTPAARSASPPRCAGSSGSSRPTARSAATG